MDLFEDLADLFVQGLGEIIEHVSNEQDLTNLSTFGGSVDFVDWIDSDDSLHYRALLAELREEARQRSMSYRNRRRHYPENIVNSVERIQDAIQQMMQEMSVNQNLDRVNWKEEGF